MASSLPTTASFSSEWKLLHKMGREKNAVNQIDTFGRSALMVCMFHDNLFSLEFLSYFADLSKPTLNHADGDGQNALTWALLYARLADKQPNLAVIEMLLEKGVNPNQVTHQGFSQAMVALYHAPEALPLLVTYGADLAFCSPTLGKTILELSLEEEGREGRPYLEKALLSQTPRATGVSKPLPRL